MIPSTKKDHYRLGFFIYKAALIFAFIYVSVFLYNYILSLSAPDVPLWPSRFVSKTLNNGQVLRIYYEDNDVLHFLNRRFFNHIQTWITPLLTSLLVIQKESLKKRNALFLLLSFWWMLIFASGARGTGVALISALLFLLLFFKSKLSQLFNYTLKSMIIGYLLYKILYFINPKNSGIGIKDFFRTGDSGRYEIWEWGFNAWIQNPIFGIGPMHVANSNNRIDHAGLHNFYLQFLTEWGVLAFILLCVLLIIFLLFITKKIMRSCINKRNTIVYFGFYWSIIAALIHGFVSGIFTTPISQIWGILILTWFMGFTVNEGKTYSIRRSMLSVLYILLVTILVAILLSIQFLDSTNMSTLYPRFWGQGKF